MNNADLPLVSGVWQTLSLLAADNQSDLDFAKMELKDV